ncbi:helix-turn-helix domain-containing protein [Actinoallomurus sp. NPDC052274]|uniref:helix-turn-helix domain-containing protein n=1 Tax=Actinoallomurus sp. NPDC052274 TaxID=3155420 RepID=UPI003445B004
MHDQTNIGGRLRVLRRWRGMTLVQLGDLSGLSASFLSMAERGLRPIDRRSHISALATALRVSETDLVGGPHLSADPVQAGPHAAIPNIREALLVNTLTAPAADQARPLSELITEMARIDRSEYKHVEVGRKLPALINELHVHVCGPADEAARRVALATLIEAFQTATFTAKDLGYFDLARIAAMRAMEVADILDDPVSKGKAASLHIHTIPMASRNFALVAAEKAADALEPHLRSSTEIPVLGMLALAAALSATVCYNYDRAEHWLDQAADLASRIPDTPSETWGAFSSTNVAIWRVGLAVERGETGAGLLRLAEKVDEDRIAGRRGRRATFLADVGRGLARDPRMRAAAYRWLRRAESVAPHKIRNSTAVHETVSSMLAQERSAAVGRELRAMAARMGIPH